MAKIKAAPPWRRAFLRVLARTGNVRVAALEAGVDKGTAYAHRGRDPAFAARWAAARARGEAAAAAGRRPPAGPLRVELVLRDGKRGPRYARAAAGRWSARVEAAFLAMLARSGCVRWAAEAAGLSTSALYYRRRAYADFAARWDAAEAEAARRLPALLTAASIASFDPELAEEADAALPRVSIAEAIQIARLKGLGRAGAGAGGDGAAPLPSIEAVRDEVLRRIAAIRRHREKPE